MTFKGSLSKKTFFIHFLGLITCAILSSAHGEGDLAYAIWIKITSPLTGQQVPAGELMISGESSDNGTSECQVYVDWNNQKPYQRATPTGPGSSQDFSNWTFTYNSSYHTIQQGINDLTSKLTCLGSPSNPLAMNKWYSINVTGINSQGSEAVQLPLPIQPSIQNGKTNVLNESTSNQIQINMVEAIDSSTGLKDSKAKIFVTVTDPSGSIIKQFDTTDGDLTRSFRVDTSGSYKVTAEVQSETGTLTKTTAFEVQ